MKNLYEGGGGGNVYINDPHDQDGHHTLIGLYILSMVKTKKKNILSGIGGLISNRFIGI